MNVVDFHNHLMPGVDDGAQTVDESCAALSHLAQEGVVAAVTTPHLNASTTLDARSLGMRLWQLDEAWTVLTQHAAEHHPGIALHRGTEIMLDTPEPDFQDARVRLAGGPFVLVEFPYMSVPPRSAEVLDTLRRQTDYIPVLAHPERYAGFAPDYSLADEWRRSAFLQVNGGSLLGRYGPDASRYARGLLERGWVAYLCSDYHARGKARIREYRQLLEELGLSDHAALLMDVNPSRMISGLTPLPVPPLRAKRTVWARVAELFRSP
jgi:protein-tyrosine phosphatase